jgi:hypothetical protein
MAMETIKNYFEVQLYEHEQVVREPLLSSLLATLQNQLHLSLAPHLCLVFHCVHVALFVYIYKRFFNYLNSIGQKNKQNKKKPQGE